MPIIIGGTQNECGYIMGQFINEEAKRMKELANDFDQLGPEMLLGVAPDEVTEEDAAAANIIRLEYMNKGNDH